MGISLNILVVLLAIIIFSIYYFIILKKDQKAAEQRPPLNKFELEVGEEMGVDEMYRELEENFVEKEIRPRDEPWLSEKYGKDYVRLISRDPNCLFAYWEINNQDFHHNLPILRLIDEDYQTSIDIQINHDTLSWYINSQPNRRYNIIIGYLKNGRFYPLVKSNVVRTPLDKPSPIIDEHWMTIEELMDYNIRIEMDSLAVIKNIERRKKETEVNVDSYSFSHS